MGTDYLILELILEFSLILLLHIYSTFIVSFFKGQTEKWLVLRSCNFIMKLWKNKVYLPFIRKIHLLKWCVLQMLMDGSYMELGKPTYLAGRNGESKLARFHVPCYHFFRLSCLLNQPVPYYQLLFNHFFIVWKTTKPTCSILSAPFRPLFCCLEDYFE